MSDEPVDMAPQRLRAETIHAGDGVYLSFDGWHINIAVNHHNSHAVALERDVWAQLVRYGERLGWKA